MSVARYLVTATDEQKWALWEQTAAVANWIEGRRHSGGGRETWLVTVYGEHATTVLDIARAVGATVEEIQGAGDTETYELRVGEPGTGWQVST
jgi:hypothetical protein